MCPCWQKNTIFTFISIVSSAAIPAAQWTPLTTVTFGVQAHIHMFVCYMPCSGIYSPLMIIFAIKIKSPCSHASELLPAVMDAWCRRGLFAHHRWSIISAPGESAEPRWGVRQVMSLTEPSITLFTSWTERILFLPRDWLPALGCWGRLTF